MSIEKSNIKTPLYKLSEISGNRLYIKREDLIPYSFGGNKARKAILFFKEIEESKANCVVTYGSGHSNHCRVVANMASAHGIPCYIIGPREASDDTYNSQMMRLFGAETITVPVKSVHDTIERKMNELKEMRMDPYFIPGGGHGNIGTQAYVNCYLELCDYEKENGVHFDYIFFASGTGTTQAGLVCGQLLSNDERRIVGISIARENPRGRIIVIDSIHAYLMDAKKKIEEEKIQASTVFLDEFIASGYGKNTGAILKTVADVMKKYGIPLDSTYTGKAFAGMEQYIREKGIKGKNILFIHTGGTPLYFDDLSKNWEGRGYPTHR